MVPKSQGEKMDRRHEWKIIQDNTNQMKPNKAILIPGKIGFMVKIL